MNRGLKIFSLILVFLMFITFIPNMSIAQDSGSTGLIKALKDTISGELYFANKSLKYLRICLRNDVYSREEIKQYISVINLLINEMNIKNSNLITISNESEEFFNVVDDILNMLEKGSDVLDDYVDDYVDDDAAFDEFDDIQLDSEKSIKNIDADSRDFTSGASKSLSNNEKILIDNLKSSVHGSLYFAYMATGAIADSSSYNDSNVKIDDLLNFLDEIDTMYSSVKYSLNEYPYTKEDKSFLNNSLSTLEDLKAMIKTLMRYLNIATNDNAEAFQKARRKAWESISE